MTTAALRHRLLARLLLVATAAGGAALLASCGGSGADLSVSVRSTQEGSVKPGETPAYVLSVVNHGPGSASGVTLRVDLPSGMEYEATTSIGADVIGASRSQPEDPSVRSLGPTWGQWTLAAPTVNADGTRRLAEVDVTFTTTVTGNPGDYTLTPHVFSDGGGEQLGAALPVHIDAAASLTATISAEQQTVARGQDLVYRVTVTNSGTGAASGVGILVTLPPGVVFEKTDRVQGNSSRGTATDPVGGTLLVYYGGWTIPAKSDAGPGLLVITMRTRCSALASGGTFPVSGQVTDAQGDIVPVNDTAPIHVTAPTAPASPGASPSPSLPGTPPPTLPPPTVQSTPAPTPTPTKHHHG